MIIIYRRKLHHLANNNNIYRSPGQKDPLLAVNKTNRFALKPISIIGYHWIDPQWTGHSKKILKQIAGHLIMARIVSCPVLVEKWCWHKAQCVAPLQSTCPLYRITIWRGEEGEMPQLKRRRRGRGRVLLSHPLQLQSCSETKILIGMFQQQEKKKNSAGGLLHPLQDKWVVQWSAIVGLKDSLCILRCEKSIWIFLLHNNANSRCQP